jgi:molybdopterin synthase catalytic subunit
MDTLVALSLQPLETHPALREPASEQTGAVVEFKGIVRRDEAGSPIAALEYEAYQPMAETMMRRIATELGAQHPCDHVLILHRTGIVPVGEAAIIIRATARHRAEAFALVSGFMDRLKQDVPIWKVRGVPINLTPTSTPK